MKMCFTAIVTVIFLFCFMGCGEEHPTDGTKKEPIKIETGISGTTYLNVEHGFRISNLPSSGWVMDTRRHKSGTDETVLRMAFATEDEFTFETIDLVEEVPRLQTEGIPYAKVSVIGQIPGLPTKPDAAKEFMNEVIAMWELFGIEVTSERPVAAVNTTGYEATYSFSSIYAPDTIWTMKQAFFAKHEMGYTIIFVAPEDKYPGLLAHIDPMIAGFELLGL